MKRTNALLWLGLTGFLAAAGCPKSAPTPTPAGSGPTKAPAPSNTGNPTPSPSEKPTGQPEATKQLEEPKDAEATKTVTTTPGGVEIEDLVIGTGAECKPQHTITAYYTGSFKSNGKVFETNVGEAPLVYPLSKLVDGWQEGIPGMKVGGKRKLTIPYQLAYGESGSPPDIPPRADLVFEIELIGVK